MFYDDQGILHVKSFSEIPEGYEGSYTFTPFYWHYPDIDSSNNSYWDRTFHDSMNIKAFNIGFKYHGKPELEKQKMDELMDKMYVDRLNEFYKYRPFMNKEDEEFSLREIKHIVSTDDWYIENFSDGLELLKSKGIEQYNPSPNK